jgi:hypothetical protein
VAVDQLVIQEAMARFVVSQGKDVVYGSGGPGTSSQVEFYAVFVLVEPDIEQEGLELHARTSEREVGPLLLILRAGAGMIFVYGQFRIKRLNRCGNPGWGDQSHKRLKAK